MIIKKAEFVTTAVEPTQYPNSDLPEIALVGRSNVGKSSLINALANRRSLARVGGTPGMTRTINFYNINDELMLVDLPGYGYARVSKEEKKSWAVLAETYLNERENLRIIILIVDIRHEPTQDDIIMVNYIKETGRSLIVAATKADKLSRSQYKKQIDMIRKVLNLDEAAEVIPFSSPKRIGIEEVWSTVETILNRV